MATAVRRRLGRSIVGGGEKRSFGEKTTPEGASRMESRTRTSLRRHFLAGGRVSAGASYGTFSPASFRRQRVRLVRNPVGNPCSGVIFSPEGASRTESRTKSRFRRQILAGSAFFSAAPSRPLAPAQPPRPSRAPRTRAAVGVVCRAGSASTPPRGIPARIDRLCKGARRGFTCATALSRTTSRCLPTTRRP